MQSTPESWKPVVGYEGLYEVSDHGRVRSLNRTVQTTRGPWRYRGKEIALCEDRKRYLWVSLYRPGASPKVGKAHRLVAEAFIGPCPPGNILCHSDGDVQNNHVRNLRWDTPQSNSADMIAAGNSTRGQKAHNVVLTEAIVREARVRWIPRKVSAAMLAREYGVNEGTLKSALRRQSWAWLD